MSSTDVLVWTMNVCHVRLYDVNAPYDAVLLSGFEVSTHTFSYVGRNPKRRVRGGVDDQEYLWRLMVVFNS